MSDAERATCGPDGPDMYLCYPPLAGKHLRVSDVAGPPGGECTVQVLQHLDSPLFAVLRTRPPDCHHEEGDTLRACRIRSGEGPNATRLPGVYRCGCRSSYVVHVHF
jgi:hypothetical protein